MVYMHFSKSLQGSKWPIIMRPEPTSNIKLIPANIKLPNFIIWKEIKTANVLVFTLSVLILWNLVKFYWSQQTK